MAQPSDALPAEGAALPQGIELLRLDGHAPAHMAVKAPDGVWFVGDAVIGETALQKYHISFLYDIGAFLHSLDVLEALPGTAFGARPMRRLCKTSVRWCRQTVRPARRWRRVFWKYAARRIQTAAC